MAHKKNTQSSDELAAKMHSSCPIRATINRVSSQANWRTTDVPKLNVQTTSPVKVTLPQNRTVDILAEPASEKGSAQLEKAAGHVRFAKVKTKKENDLMREGSGDDEGKFSDYIDKVKKRMMRTMSSVGGLGARISKGKDSFDGKVTTYIDKSKGKIRKMNSISF